MENRGNGIGSAGPGDSLRALQGLGGLGSETASELNQMVESKASQGQQSDGDTQGQGAQAGNPDNEGNAGQVASAPEGDQGAAGQGTDGAAASNEGGADSAAAAGDTAGANSNEGGEGSDDLSIDSPLFGGKKTVNPANEQDGSQNHEFENIDAINSYLKETLGIEDVSALPGTLKEFSEQKEQLSKLTEQNSNVETLFQSMPAELYQAVTMFANGEEWRSALNTSSVDFTKEAKDFDAKDLVNSMMPGKLTEEDWEHYSDEDGDPAVKRLVQTYIDSATNEFNNKKSAIENARVESVAKAKENEAKFNESFINAKAELKASFPDASEDYVADIENMFKTGSINSLFFNEDGTLKKDALMRASMARDGKGLVDQYQGIIERRVETKVNQDILSRGAETPATTQGSATSNRGSDDIREEVKDTVAAIKGLKPQGSF